MYRYGCRVVRTTAEHKANEDTQGVNVRPKRKGRLLPTYWFDQMRERNRSWKKNRTTQYK